MGAESLLGQGDMLFLPPGTGYPQRVHGAFVADDEVHRVVEYLKQFGEPEYEDGILAGVPGDHPATDLLGDAPDAQADPLYDEAGDMLYLPPGTGLPIRVHGAFVSDDEVHRVVEKLKEQGEPNYVDGLLESGIAGEGDEAGGAGAGGAGGESDPLYDQAVEIVIKQRRASISLVQRHLRIGYNRAARLVEQMEAAGLVSSMGVNGSREVLAPAPAD
ncbi:hypothetical protein DFQ30_000969 [Apophysomyces sp. BC1015]|nr:hypothetical protein DFQ30_000969 [Apophysomyces sp. BC1015]